MAKKTRRASVIVHHNTDDLDARFKLKKSVPRKVLRKQQRQLAKQQHHQNRLNYNAKRKAKFGSKTEKAKPLSEEDVKQEASSLPQKKSFQLNEREQLEIDYLEKKLLKGKNSRQSSNVFHQLKKEFLNDGFDEDFIDFLANIQDAAPEQEILKDYSGARKTKKGRDDVPPDYSDSEDDAVENDNNQSSKKPGGDGCRRVRFVIPGEPVPTAAKAQEESESSEIDVDVLCKKQMGLINRLSDGNVKIVTDEIIKLYQRILAAPMETSDIYINLEKLITSLCKIIVGTIIEDVNTVISLVAVQTFLVCALSNRIGVSIGYVFCHVLHKTFQRSLVILQQNKESDELRENKLVLRNSLMSFAFIAHCNMLDVQLVFEVINALIENGLTEHIAQLVLTFLRYTGHQLREHNLDAFNNLLNNICRMLQDQKDLLGKDYQKSTIRFFEEEIDAFKHSREKKPFETFEYLRELIVKGNYASKESQNARVLCDTLKGFSIEFDKNEDTSTDILQKLDISQRIGSSISQNDAPDSTPSLLEKAIALKLYSNVQKATFVAVMGAQDVNHAVQRILDMNLKAVKYPEVVQTIVRCLLAESAYNRYYAHVLLQLAGMGSTIGKRFARAVVACTIASIKRIHDTKGRYAAKLGRLFATLMTKNVLDMRLLFHIPMDAFDYPATNLFFKRLFLTFCVETKSTQEEGVIAQLLAMAQHQEHTSINVSAQGPNNSDDDDHHETSAASHGKFHAISQVWISQVGKTCESQVYKCNASPVVLEAIKRIFRAT